jgi:hypothetical protein
MSTEIIDASETTSSPRGLATVALLKARFDEGVDQIDLFMPLVADSIDNLQSNDFIVADVQKLLHERHGIAIPQHTLATLLKRMIRKGFLRREFSRYKRIGRPKQRQDLLSKKTAIEEQQKTLAREFRTHTSVHGIAIDSDEAALSMILTFLEDNQVAMLLGAEQRHSQGNRLSSRDSRAVAEFAQAILSSRPDLARILQNILEGLVVYNTAFLRDITSTSHQLIGLRVYFDTSIAFELLGYEGEAQAVLARETLNLLKNVGVQGLVFNKTIQEMQSILRTHENKLGTTQGVRALRPTPMSRFMVTNHYTPSDVRQMSALIPTELSRLGIQVAPIPKHIPKYTLDEKKLSEILADKQTHDIEEPRVVHDVDCVAAILTLRKGIGATSLAGVKAVFASKSKLVITNVQRWYGEQGETGIGPIVDIRALSNLAWVRKPALAENLKAHELVALCHAALQPSRKTWERFLQHLNSLERNHTLTSDEAVAVVVSEFTDVLLSDVVDEDDIDAATLDEVVDRVRAHYEAEAKKRIEQHEDEAKKRIDSHEAEAKKRLEEQEAETKSRIEEHETAAKDRLVKLNIQEPPVVAETTSHIIDSHPDQHPVAEDYRQLKLRVEGKSTGLTQLIAKIIYWFVITLVIMGALTLVVGHPFHSGMLGILVGFGLVIFTGMELLGVLQHASHLRTRLESLALPRIRRALGADEPPRPRSSLLGLDTFDTDDKE